MINTEELRKQDFLPVLLGSDINVYGMARSFHEAYGIRSVAVGKGILPACMNSHIVEVQTVEPRLEEDEVFVNPLPSWLPLYLSCPQFCQLSSQNNWMVCQFHSSMP